MGVNNRPIVKRSYQEMETHTCFTWLIIKSGDPSTVEHTAVQMQIGLRATIDSTFEGNTLDRHDNPATGTKTFPQDSRFLNT